jgi:hypothetical protein
VATNLDRLGEPNHDPLANNDEVCDVGSMTDRQPDTESGLALLRSLRQPYPIPPAQPHDLIRAIEAEARAPLVAALKRIADDPWNAPGVVAREALAATPEAEQ